MKCGETDKRNEEYLRKYGEKEFFRSLIKSEKPIVFDVGAHKGESVQFFSDIFENATIYSFEPDPDNFRHLADFCQDLPCTSHLFNLALGARSGDVQFFRQDISHLNSIYPINRDSNDSLGYAEGAYNQSVMVKMTTLNDMLTQTKIDRCDLLKIDVEAAEVDVLEGAVGDFLKIVKNITLELNFFDFYGRSNSFYEVEKLLNPFGFKLFSLLKLSQNPKNGRTDKAEVVYTQRG